MQKIVVIGGTGFIGQGILLQLQISKQFELISISKSGGKQTQHLPHVQYLAADLNKNGDWQAEVRSADWVIDCVGILFPNHKKGLSYEKNSLLPALRTIQVLKDSPQTRFLFINANANYAPLKEYMNIKHAIANYAHANLPGRDYNVYPGLVYDKSRRSTYWVGYGLNFLIKYLHFNFLKRYRPISRQKFSVEIEKILLNQNSFLLHQLK